MKSEGRNFSSYLKYGDRVLDFEKRNLKKAFGNNCREIINVSSNISRNSEIMICFDLIVICDFSNLKNISSVLTEFKYSITSKKEYIFTSRKNGKIFTIYLVEYKSKNYFILNDFFEYLAANIQKEKEYAALKNQLYASCKDFFEYEYEKLLFIKKISFDAVCWKTLGKKVNISGITENHIYSLQNNEFCLNIGVSDRGIYGNKVLSYIMGVKKSVHKFSGKIIAVIKNSDESVFFVVAPLNKIYYEPDIITALKQTVDLSKSKVICLYEKSCGAVVYKKKKDTIYYLLIKNRSKNIGFPKGHVEENENEIDTALREIFEETNINVNIDKHFRIAYNYNINFFIKKQAVYFLAQMINEDIKIPDNEILSYHFVSYTDAMALLTYPNEKKILKSANQYIKNKRG